MGDPGTQLFLDTGTLLESFSCAIVLHTPMSCLLPFRRTTPAALAAAGGPRASHKKMVATRKPPRECPPTRRNRATGVKQNPPTMAANLDSMFLWLIGLACLVASTEAQPSGCSGLPNSPCGVLTSSTGSVSKMQFKDSGMADMVVLNTGSSVKFEKQAFKGTPSSGAFTVHMECSGGSCTKGAACTFTAGSCSDCVSCPSCTGDERKVESGDSKWYKEANSLSFVTYCGGEFGSDPSPSPSPPPAAPPVVCGPGTTLDGNTCKIDCDESNPPGRRLSENPFAPADADASDTARESREQSARAGKAVDSYLASQPDLDDAQRSVISFHLERFAAEILWFTDEEE